MNTVSTAPKAKSHEPKRAIAQSVNQQISASNAEPSMRAASCACGGGCARCNNRKNSSRGILQAKLEVGAPDDAYEQEADRVADEILATPSGNAISSKTPPLIQRLTIQTVGYKATAPPSVEHVLSGSGRSLDTELQQDMSQRFGQDFSEVRVYTGVAAEQSAQEINAHAYTVGRNIVFGAGQFAPSSQQGKRLLAHELTHVVQQSSMNHTFTAQSALSVTSHPIQRQPIRADEMGPGGTDRFAAQTSTCGSFSVFIPSGANTTTNNIHIFFSPGDVTGSTGSDAVAVHGLHGAADSSSWIIIGVPGVLGGATTVSDAQIISCLTAAGRPASIAAVRLSAHSRGNAGLAATLRRRLITPGLIQHVTILDGQDHQTGLTAGLQRSGVPATNVTAYNVVFGAFQPFSVSSGGSMLRVQNFQLRHSCMRSIGYARLISDAMATGRVTSPLPAAIAARITALSLPPRGTFTTANPAPTGKQNVDSFCSDPANAAALRDMRFGEPANPTSLLSPRVQTSTAMVSPYAFIEENNAMGFNNPAIPRSQWIRFNPQIYAHHLFVAEFAHEMFP